MTRTAEAEYGGWVRARPWWGGDLSEELLKGTCASPVDVSVGAIA